MHYYVISIRFIHSLIQVVADSGCTLSAHGLKPNEEYVFAVAAYSINGELIGDSIGHTSRPIVACYSLPLIAAWGYCCEVSVSFSLYAH